MAWVGLSRVGLRLPDVTGAHLEAVVAQFGIRPRDGPSWAQRGLAPVNSGNNNVNKRWVV